MNIPKGWKLVPIDATRAMIDAAAEAEEDGYDAMHKAMLKAAPAAPIPTQEDELIYQSSWDQVYWADISKTEFEARQGITNIHNRTLYTRPDNGSLK